MLANIAKAIHAMLRTPDLVGRWGEKEFLIILPRTWLDGGYKLAEKIRAHVSSLEFAEMDQVTASFGITAFVRSDDIEDIIASADAGLYAAKRRGRNRVNKVIADAKVVPDLRFSNQRRVRSLGDEMRSDISERVGSIVWQQKSCVQTLSRIDKVRLLTEAM